MSAPLDAELRRTTHGPITRLSFAPTAPPRDAQVSVYLVGDALVDTGSTRVSRAVLAALRDRPPRRIVLTHQHEDHVGNVRLLLDALGPMPVLAPRELIDVIVATRRVPPYRAAFFGHPHPIERAELSPYDDGDELDCGGVTLTAQATPGHTPGHMALVVREGGLARVMTGDLFTPRPLEVFFEAAIDDAMRSYRAVAALAPDVRLLPTHGRARDDGRAALLRGADELEALAARVHAEVARSGDRDPVRVSERLFGDDPMRAISGGEIGHAVFVRAVLEPVRRLPAIAVTPPAP